MHKVDSADHQDHHLDDNLDQAEGAAFRSRKVVVAVDKAREVVNHRVGRHCLPVGVG